MIQYTNKKLQSLREKAGLSREGLSHLSGVSFSAIFKLERTKNITYPSTKTLAQIINALNANINDFFENT